MFLVCGEALFDFFLESEAGPGGGDLRRAGRAARRSTWRSGCSGWGQAVGAADRPLERPARAAAAAGAGGGGGVDATTRSRPTGRRRSASSGSTPRACRPTSSTTTARPTPASRRPTCRRSGRRWSGCTSAPTRWRRRRSATRWRRWRAARAGGSSRSIPNVRPTVEPDMDVWRARLAVLFPLADLVKISAEDLELLWPGKRAEALRRRPGRGGREPGGGDRRRRGGARLDRGGLHATATPPRVKVIDTVGAGDTFQAALLARLMRDPAGAEGGARGAGREGAGRARRLCRAGRGDHLLAARRGPAAGRRADRLKETHDGLDRHPRAAVRPGDLRRHRRSRAPQDPAEPLPALGGAPGPRRARG